MRKPSFCICENKDADQLCGNNEADKRLCFRYTDSTIPLLPKYEISSLAIFCGCTAGFVSDLVGYPEDRFSHDEAHQISVSKANILTFQMIENCSKQNFHPNDYTAHSICLEIETA